MAEDAELDLVCSFIGLFCILFNTFLLNLFLCLPSYFIAMVHIEGVQDFIMSL